MELVALLPWWAGVGLALAGYVTFHALAAPPKVDPLHVASAVQPMMVAALAGWAQYIVPVLCLIGAGVSFARRKKREALFGEVAKAKSADALDGMSWREFEMLVGEAFRVQGYSVVELGGAKPDGGVDLVLKKGDEKVLVQCKHWKAFKVDVRVVRELYGVMAAQGATGGYVITSGSFTRDAEEFASGRNLTLIDGGKLFALIRQGRSAREQSAPVVARADVPSCPICSCDMVRRTAKKGAEVGKQFWGCSRFPACRGTRA